MRAVWDVSPDFLKREAQFPTFRPAYQFNHNCQTVRSSSNASTPAQILIRLQGKWVTLLRAQWSPNPDVYPHFTVRPFSYLFMAPPAHWLGQIANMDHSLELRSWKVRSHSVRHTSDHLIRPQGELLAKLADKSKITAVQAVACLHPSITERAASGNASGRCVLWAPEDL